MGGGKTIPLFSHFLLGRHLRSVLRPSLTPRLTEHALPVPIKVVLELAGADMARSRVCLCVVLTRPIAWALLQQFRLPHRRMWEGAVVAACFFLGAMQAARQA